LVGSVTEVARISTAAASALVVVSLAQPMWMKHGRQSTKGYTQGSDLSADKCASYELDGDARQTRFYPGSATVRA
jgi:hypothetical protein